MHKKNVSVIGLAVGCRAEAERPAYIQYTLDRRIRISRVAYTSLANGLNVSESISSPIRLAMRD